MQLDVLESGPELAMHFTSPVPSCRKKLQRRNKLISNQMLWTNRT